MISKENKAEFKSLGVDQVQSRVTASLWSEDKLRQAREWLYSETNRVAISAKNAAWAAAAAALFSAIAAIAALVIAWRGGASLPI